LEVSGIFLNFAGVEQIGMMKEEKFKYQEQIDTLLALGCQLPELFAKTPTTVIFIPSMSTTTFSIITSSSCSHLLSLGHPELTKALRFFGARRLKN
jgi:hypothetical protein